MLEETSLKSRPISLTRKVFMPHLETLIAENRTWAHEHEVGRPTLYPQCHLEKIQTEKYWKDFDITVGLSRRIYNYYLDFEK